MTDTGHGVRRAILRVALARDMVRVWAERLDEATRELVAAFEAYDEETHDGGIRRRPEEGPGSG